MQLTRRKFLLFSGATVAAALAGISGQTLFVDRRETLVLAIIHKHLPGVRITDADLAKFAKDFVSHSMYKESKVFRYSSGIARFLLHSPYQWLPTVARERLNRLESTVLRDFFLGTNFFDDQDPFHRKVFYIAFPDPYTLHCANRLARYDDGANRSIPLKKG